MSRTDDLELVIRLACCVEDKTRAEEAALLRVAAKLETELNRVTVTNRRDGGVSNLVDIVEETTVRTVDAKTRAKLLAARARFATERSA